VCEVLARTCPSTAICFGMHCVGTVVIAAKATPTQRERYLAPIAAGRHLTTLALSEPGSGAHFYLPQAGLATESPALFRLSGTKTFVTNGAHADSYVMSTVAADPDAPPGTFSCVVVRAGADGLSWGEPWRGLGMRGNDARTATLQEVPVPREDLLGEVGDQIWYVFEVVAPAFLMAMSGTYLGIATSALEAARQHLQQRSYTLSGATLAHQPILQHRLGVLWAMVERTRQLVYAAAARADAGDPEVLPALLSAKAEVADCVVAVTNEAMTLGGGIAYRDNARLARALRDGRAAPVMAPTTDLLRTWTGRALLGLPLPGE
jgi:alkylation response protein AidB-like acyl-CoA dehydrogenase